MGWPVCNMTEEYETIVEDEFYSTGLTFHQLAEVISLACTFVAVVVSLLLIFLHATHYSRPYEQRPIIRILFMVPVYAMVSCVSLYYYKHDVYFEAIRDCYEAFAIASFFTLVCHYIAPDLHDQKEYFRGIKPKPWVWPMNWLKRVWGGDKGPWRTPRSGLTWFNVIWASVFQYCFIRVSMTIVTCLTQYFGRYCEESLNPAFSHIWVLCIESLCVTIAMYAIIQFYVQLREDLAPHSPFMKVLAIKLVIFLSFWQTIVIELLASANVLQASSTIANPDIKTGISNMLLCMEMSLFAIFHIWAFSYRPYILRNKKTATVEDVPGDGAAPSTDRYHGGILGVRAYMDAFNPWDLIKAMARGVRWMLVGRRKRTQDPSYTNAGLDGAADENPATAFPGPNITGYNAGRPQKPSGSPVRFSNNSDENQELLSTPQKTPISIPSQTHNGENIGLATWNYNAETSHNNKSDIFAARREEMEAGHDEWRVKQNEDYQKRYYDMVKREEDQERERQAELGRNQSRRAPNDPFRDPNHPHHASQQSQPENIFATPPNQSHLHAVGDPDSIGVGLAYPMDAPEVQMQTRRNQAYSPTSPTHAQSQGQAGFVTMPDSMHFQPGTAR